MEILKLPKFNMLNVAENEYDLQIRVEANSSVFSLPSL